MKNTFILLLLAVLYFNCSDVQDDTGISCFSDCTVIEGSIITLKSQPIPNIPIEFKNDQSQPYQIIVREIKKTKTNENGYYNMPFYLEDDELGEDGKGTFKLLLDFSTVDPKEYLLPKNVEIRNGFYISNISSILKRDTIIVKDFYLPKRSHLTFNMENFVPLHGDDYFRAQLFYQGGFTNVNKDDNPDFDYGPLRGENFHAIDVDNVFEEVQVAAGLINVFVVSKKKNGVYSTEEIPFYAPDIGGTSVSIKY